MKIYFSKSTGGFYDSRIHQSMPADVVEITEERRLELLDKQSSGERVVSDAHGVPFTVPPASEVLATAARDQRNALLTQSDWTQVADAPVDQAAWATYRQALRDVPAQAGFPETIVWPIAPN